MSSGDRQYGQQHGAARRPLQRRFMRRMSVKAKLWTTTIVLALPLVGLGIFYVQSLTDTLWFTQKEQAGQQLFHPLDSMVRAIASHQAARAAAQSGDKTTADTLQPLESRIDEALRALEKTDAAIGSSNTHKEVQALSDKWTAARGANPGDDAAYTAALEASYALKDQITSDWMLALDPELVAYDLLDVSTNKLPDATRFMGELRVALARMGANAGYTPAQANRAVALAALVRDRMSAAGSESQQALGSSADRPTLAAQLRQVGSGGGDRLTAWLDRLDQTLSGGHPGSQAIQELLAAAPAIDDLQDGIANAADLALKLRYDTQLRRAIIALTSSALALVVAILLMLALSGRITGAIKRLLHVSEQIAEGHYDNAIDVTGQDEISRLFAGMDAMQRRLKSQIEAERRAASANERIKQALDSVSTSVMMADPDHRLTYMNPAMSATLLEAEGELRKALPRFPGVEKVLGAEMEVLHEQPQQQREILRTLTSTQRGEVSIGSRTFVQIVNPIVGSAGERLGTVVEWIDRTKELRIEREVEGLLADVLDGNLSRRIQVPENSGFAGVMASSLNQLAETMFQIILAVKDTAESVHRGASEIAQGNADLSQRTEAQSSSLEQTASSMEQMTSTVKQNADNTAQANDLVSAAREQAEKGGQVTSKAVSAMAGISESSRKISDITGVIDEIAFQTNLLALNAAVEAARAGEQGRGFAVVASEVRNLAGRSATAAKEIKELIEDSAKKVEDGSLLVSESGKMLEQIVLAVKKVSDIVAEIASASTEQSAGIEQVNRAVMQMDEMTQRNAALVEEATAASKSMAEQASALNGMLEKYQLGDAPAARAKIPGRARTGLGVAA